MKKLFLLMVIALFLTGCGNKVKCVKNVKENNQQSTVTAYFKGDNLTKLISVEKMTFKSSDEVQEICNSLQNSSKNDNLEVECKHRTITSTVTSNEKIKMSKEDFIKSYKSDGYSCK